MLGAIAGDIIGSVYEWNRIKSLDFPLFSQNSKFTDDTVMTVAVADCILNNKSYIDTFKYYGHKYPSAGYGSKFKEWLFSESSEPYYSCGNGSAMRVSPVGFAFNTIEEVMNEAKRTAEVTHNHPEGIKGAQSVAIAIFLARTGNSKEEIKKYIEKFFNYNLSRTIADIRYGYTFDGTCQGSVPESIIAFLEAENFEDAVRKAVSLGGDSDTIACIAGAIAEAFYKDIPNFIINKTIERLTPEIITILQKFREKFDLQS